MSKRAVAIEDLKLYRLPSNPKLNPDGSKILFSLREVKEKGKTISHLWMSDASGVRQLTQGSDSCGSGSWIGDSNSILFTSSRGEAGSQFFILPESGEAQQITKLPEGTIGAYEISPNGKLVAYTFRETHPDFTKKAGEERKENGGSEPAIAFESTWYRLDGDSTFGEQRFKLYLLDLATKESRLLSDESAMGGYSFAWSPDSAKLAFTRSIEPDPFVAKPNEQVFIHNLQDTATQVPNLPKGYKDALKWSPDGVWLSVAGNTDQEDAWGTNNTHLYLVKPDGSDFRDLTGHADYDFDVATLGDSKDAPDGACYFWSADSKTIWAHIGHFGAGVLASVDVASGNIEVKSADGQALFLGTSNKACQSLPAIVCNTIQLPRLVKVDLSSGRVDPVASFNDAYEAEVEICAPEEHWVESPDGTKVHTWVIKPCGLDENKQHPAILEVHGGPHTQYGYTMFHEFQVLAAQGYVVVYSNPRGSKGYGQAHCAAIRGDWGNADWIDVKAVSDWMTALPYVDSSRTGIMGGSYGGYMTNWAIAHTHQFRAAITDRCVSNLVSMSGNSDFPVNRDEYFRGTAWGDLQDIAELWKQSPISHFKGVKTPTLIIHSEGDLRCNIEQSEQVFIALKMQGVETRFVRYPKSTSHGMSRTGPSDLKIHRLNEIVSWWKRFF